jgi:hypothetical protein
MRACTECGTPFQEAAAWAPGVCGQCLADRIEASLMLQLLCQRKPAKRAEDLARQQDAAQERRSA